MGIGTSDGQVYEDELQYHMGQPLQITITKQKQPELDNTGPFANGPQGFDDGPTLDQQLRNGPSIYNTLKDQEKQMEENQFVNDHLYNEDTPFIKPMLQHTADRPVQAEDIHRLQGLMENGYYQRPGVKSPSEAIDPFNTKTKGKSQDRVPQSSGELRFNPASPEQVVASQIADKPPVDKPTPYDEWLKTVPNYDPNKEAGPNNKPHNEFNDGIPSAWDIPADEYNATWEGLKHFKGSGKDFLKTLPDNYEAFRFNDNMYMIRKRRQSPPKLEDLISLQIDRTDGEVNLLSNDKIKVAASDNSLTDLARGAYRRFLDILGTHAASTPAQQERRQELTDFLRERPMPPNEARPAPSHLSADEARRWDRFEQGRIQAELDIQGNPIREPRPYRPLADEASNTFGRELRRSPADGTFRSWDQYHNDWEGFNQVRIRRPRPERNIDNMSVREARDEISRIQSRAANEGRPYSESEIRRINSLNTVVDDQFRQRPWTEEDEARSRSRSDIEPAENWRERFTSGRQSGQVEFETKTGKAGVVSYIYNPSNKDIYIQWMGAKDGHFYGGTAIEPHELGIDKTMQILKAVVEQYPEAKTISAIRAGGARVNNPHGGGSKKITRPIPRDRLEATAPATSAVVPSATQNMPGLPSPAGGAMPGTRLTDLY